MNIYQQNFISEADAKKYTELLAVYEKIKPQEPSKPSETSEDEKPGEDGSGSTGGTTDDDLKDE